MSGRKSSTVLLLNGVTYTGGPVADRGQLPSYKLGVQAGPEDPGSSYLMSRS
jgi:hypothetical protein